MKVAETRIVLINSHLAASQNKVERGTQMSIKLCSSSGSRRAVPSSQRMRRTTTKTSWRIRLEFLSTITLFGAAT